VDFDDTREEAAFRTEARQWLAAHAEPKRGAFETWQSRYPGREGWDGLERAKAFQSQKAEAGFAALHWPAEWGGRALPPIYQVIYAQEESRFLVPRGYFEIGLGMCMPTLFAYGTESQKQRYAPAALRGDEVWCQLFSEPGAGSDLAGLRTRAQRDGDDWVINGQKPTGRSWSRAAMPRSPSTRA
jgi:alkylation response protein AidB-like acyl-CoA dehydrogenase